MRTAITVPDDVFDAAEKAAKQLAISRSDFYTEAVRQFLLEHGENAVSARLNEVYSTNSSQLDPVLGEMALRSIAKDSW